MLTLSSFPSSSTMTMMRAALFVVLCLFALSCRCTEGGTLRRVLDDEPVAAPSERESEPAEVFVDAPAPTPAADDVNAEAAPVADEDDEDDEYDEDLGDEDTQPTPAPSEPDGGGEEGVDEPEGNAAPETTPAAGDEGNETEVPEATPEATPEGTEAPAEPTEAGGDDEGGAGGDNGETTVPTTAPKTQVTPEPTRAPDTQETPEPTMTPTEDDDGGYGDDEDGEDDYDEWDNYPPPTEKPVVYVPPDEDADPIKNTTDTGAGSWIQTGETPEEMMHDRNVLIAVGVLCGVSVLLMIITAHQMVENPDGCCASVCRLMYSCTCCIFRTICYPCRAICGCTRNKRRARQHQMLSGNGNYTHDLELS